MRNFRLLPQPGLWDDMGADPGRWHRFAQQRGIPELARRPKTIGHNREDGLNGHRRARTNAWRKANDHLGSGPK